MGLFVDSYGLWHLGIKNCASGIDDQGCFAAIEKVIVRVSQARIVSGRIEAVHDVIERRQHLDHGVRLRPQVSQTRVLLAQAPDDDVRIIGPDRLV